MVAVPLPLSKAPIPSGMPAKRQAEPSALVEPATASPALSSETKLTEGSTSTRQGVWVVEGPVVQLGMMPSLLCLVGRAVLRGRTCEVFGRRQVADR
jgi:hypothetical protein